MDTKLSQRLEEKSREVKEQTAQALEADITLLETAVSERALWLEDHKQGSSEKPKFSRYYTTKSSNVAQNKDRRTEERLSRMEERIIRSKLTREQRSLIESIRQRTQESIQREERIIRADYIAYMSDNPAYAGLSDSDTELAQRDLAKCLRSMESRLTYAMELEINSVTAETRVRRQYGDVEATPLPSDLAMQDGQSSQRVEEYKCAAIAKYKQAKACMEQVEQEELACFDNEASDLRSRGASEADIKKYRQEALNSCRKTNADKLQRLSKTINREVRALIAADRESQVSREHVDRLGSMMIAYRAACSSVEYSPSICSLTSTKAEDVANIIDLGFEQSEGSWESFLSVASYYLPMLDQERSSKDRMMRLYAVCMLSSDYKPGSAGGAFGELEQKIETLRSKRDALLKDVRFQDARIKQRLLPPVKKPAPKKAPAISKYTKSYMDYLSKAPPVVMPGSCSDGSNTRAEGKMSTYVRQREIEAAMSAVKPKKAHVDASSYALREARDNMR